MADTFHWDIFLVIMGSQRHFLFLGTVLVFSEVTDVLIFVMVDEIFKKKIVLNQHVEVKPCVSICYFSISV